MSKRAKFVAIILLVIISASLLVNVVAAVGVMDTVTDMVGGIGPGSATVGTGNNASNNVQSTTDANKPSFMERQLATLINSLYFGLYKLGLKDIQEMVFNKPVSATFSPIPGVSLTYNSGPLPDVWGVFYNQEYNGIIKKMHSGFASLAWLMCVAAIMLGGSKLSASTINSRIRVNFIDMVWNWIVAVILITFSLTLISVLFSLNTGLVDLFSSQVADKSFSFYDLGVSVTEKSGTGVVQSLVGGALTTAIIKLVALGLGLWINFIYINRYIMLMILVVSAPIFCGFWFFDRTRGLFWSWFKELVSNISIQSIHAFMLMVFFSVNGISIAQPIQSSALSGPFAFGSLPTVLLTTAPAGGGVAGGSSWLWKIAFLVFFVPATDVVRRMIGAGGSSGGMMSQAMMGMGMGALVGTASLMGKAGTAVKDVRRSGGFVESVGGGHPVFSGSEGTPGVPAGYDNIAKARNIAGTAGRVMGGAAGMLMGLGTGNPFMMANMGRMGASVGGGVASAGGGFAAMSYTASTSPGILDTGVTSGVEQDEKLTGQVQGYNAGHMVGQALFGDSGGRVFGKMGAAIGGFHKESAGLTDVPNLSEAWGDKAYSRSYADHTEFWQNGKMVGYNGQGDAKAGNGYIETEYLNDYDKNAKDSERNLQYRPTSKPYIVASRDMPGGDFGVKLQSGNSVDGIRWRTV